MVKDCITKLLRGVRRVYQRIFHTSPVRWGWPEDEPKERQETNDLIYDLLVSREPCLIGRVGTSEGNVVHNYLAIISKNTKLKQIWSFIKYGDKLPWWEDEQLLNNIKNNSGVFDNPFTTQTAEEFAKIYLKYIPQLDVCGRFAAYEYFLPFSKNCKFVQLETLYPFFVERPWMKALEGKKVLVIHPFKESIEEQYTKRNLLFDNADCLPQFELKVIKAVQSIAGEPCEFNSWFDALAYMKSEIDKTDFDVAIIGCGAYGLPLAGYVKEIGKKAVFMGGGLQLIFGIKGKRWESQYENPCYRNLFNQYWVYPKAKETPSASKKVENACYW